MAARTSPPDPITGCQAIQGCKVGPNGYGQIMRENGQRTATHRAAWELARGPIPDGQRVCHRCDNPRCVNPDHLYLGSQADNIRESVCKGRYNAFGHQKLNARHVLAIRQLSAAGWTRSDLARQFGIAKNTVSGIVHRATWAHLPDEPSIETLSDGALVRVPSCVLPVRGDLHVGLVRPGGAVDGRPQAVDGHPQPVLAASHDIDQAPQFLVRGAQQRIGGAAAVAQPTSY